MSFIKQQYNVGDRVIMADWFYENTGTREAVIVRPLSHSGFFYTVTGDNKIDWRVHKDAIISLVS